MAIRNRYPRSEILEQRGHWDKATRDVVLDRVHNVPEYRHFTDHARMTLEALCELVMPQGWKPAERRIPIAPWIDHNCLRGTLEGFRFDNMPENAVAWDWGLIGLDETAHALFDRNLIDLDGEQQNQVLEAVRDGNSPGEIWTRLPAKRWWIYIAVRQITGIYYAHPYAWDEIGFGGPAYPRGYAALNFGAPEPWEAKEVKP